MEQKILSLKDDKIISEAELIEYPAELIGGRNLFALKYSFPEILTSKDFTITRWAAAIFTKDGVIANLSPSTKYTIKYTVELTEKYDVDLLQNNRIGRLYFYNRPYGVFITSGISVDDYRNAEIGDRFEMENTFTTPSNLENYAILVYTTTGRTGSGIATGSMRFLNFKLERGNKATPYTPAPEDLDLSYPDFITEFKPSISDRYILTGELVEGQPTSFGNKITTNEFIEQ